VRTAGHLARQPVVTGKTPASVQELAVLADDFCHLDSPRLRNPGYCGLVKSLKHEPPTEGSSCLARLPDRHSVQRVSGHPAGSCRREAP